MISTACDATKANHIAICTEIRFEATGYRHYSTHLNYWPTAFSEISSLTDEIKLPPLYKYDLSI